MSHFVTRRRLRAGTTLAISVAALTAAVALPAESSAQRSHVAAVGACPATGLVAWLDTNGNGAAGTIFYTLHLTNLSGRRCTVRGYPGVSAASLSGRQVGPGALRSGQAARTVTLARGADAKANLGIAEAGNYPPARCRRVLAAGLRVFSPGSTLARLIPYPFQACTRLANLRISPVR